MKYVDIDNTRRAYRRDGIIHQVDHGLLDLLTIQTHDRQSVLNVYVESEVLGWPSR